MRDTPRRDLRAYPAFRSNGQLQDRESVRTNRRPLPGLLSNVAQTCSSRPANPESNNTHARDMPSEYIFPAIAACSVHRQVPVSTVTARAHKFPFDGSQLSGALWFQWKV